jgi:hypothetical protein
MGSLTELINWISIRGAIWVALPLLSLILFEAACVLQVKRSGRTSAGEARGLSRKRVRLPHKIA